jgi:glycosyltransferase involved in cell wall biosynthesis
VPDLDVSVVVASHGRAERLPALLDSLAEQTLDAGRWELVVVHIYEPAVAREVLDGHPLRRQLRHLTVDASVARPSLQRNVGWRAARGRLIAFIDDDCRAHPEWLKRLVQRFDVYPGAIVQGATWPDAREIDLLRYPHVHTLMILPPGRYAQTCNILYERALLERLDGFDERAITGEDMDLALRAQADGVTLVGEPDAIAYHAVYRLSLREQIRFQRKWQHLAYVVKRHPELRAGCVFGLWWKREHLAAVVALAAVAAATWQPWTIVGVFPYLQLERWRYGTPWWQQRRALRELPAHWLIELCEVATFVRGSIRYRTFVL